MRFAFPIMSDQILEKLFDSPVKVRLLKFFLRNHEGEFQAREVIKRLRLKPQVAGSHIRKFIDIGFLSERNIACPPKLQRRGADSKFRGSKKRSAKISKKRLLFANPKFDFFPELKNLVLKSSPASKEKLLENIKNLGRIKFALISGVFINNENSRADLLLVCDNIKENRLKAYLKNLEAEVGREVEYVVFTTEEFNYRKDMFDKFLRDILEGPREILVNKLRL